MRAVPGTQLKFDWNPNGDVLYSEMLASYPGDDVVDYIGLDLYDVSWAGGTYPYPVPCDDACRLDHQKKAWASFQAPALANFLKFSKLHGKPLSVPEWGLIDNKPGLPGGGDNPYYIGRMLDFILNPDNNVAYASYFDVDTSENNMQLSDISSDDSHHSKITKAPLGAALFRSTIQAKLANDGSLLAAPAPIPNPPELKVTLALTSAPSFVVGASAKFTATLNTNQDLAGLIVKAQLSDLAGKVFAEGRVTNVAAKTAAANQVEVSVEIPKTLVPGSYKVAGLIYDTAWKSLAYREGPTFRIEAVPPPTVAFTASTTAEKNVVPQGQTLNLRAKITGTLDAPGDHVNFKIATIGGTAVGEVTVPRDFAANVTSEVAASYAVPTTLAPGKYKVVLVVWDARWKPSYYQDALEFTVVAK